MSSRSLSRSATIRIGKAIEDLPDLWRRRTFSVALGPGNLEVRNVSTSPAPFRWVDDSDAADRSGA